MLATQDPFYGRLARVMDAHAAIAVG